MYLTCAWLPTKALPTISLFWDPAVILAAFDTFGLDERVFGPVHINAVQVSSQQVVANDAPRGGVCQFDVGVDFAVVGPGAYDRQALHNNNWHGHQHHRAGIATVNRRMPLTVQRHRFVQHDVV